MKGGGKLGISFLQNTLSGSSLGIHKVGFPCHRKFIRKYKLVTAKKVGFRIVLTIVELTTLYTVFYSMVSDSALLKINAANMLVILKLFAKPY